MPLKFDPQTGLSVDEVADVRDAIRADWIAAFAERDKPPLNVAPESPAGQLIDSETALVAAKDSELLYLANMFNPQTAEGVWQDALGKIYFQKRHMNDPSVVTCTCMGRYGTVIPAGSIVLMDDGHTLTSTSEATIGSGGTADVIFQMREGGPVPIPAGTVNAIVTTIPGWDTVTNPAAGTVGRFIESQAEYESRRKKSVALNAHGSVIAIYAAVAAVRGVLDCMVLENVGPDPIVKYGVTIGGHSVCVSVYGGADEDIAEAIYLKKDGGCGTSGDTRIAHVATDFNNAVYRYGIVRPTPTPIRMHAHIILTSEPRSYITGMPSPITGDVRNAIIGDFNGENAKTGNPRVGMASRVYASRFYPACILTAGVVELVDIKIALGTGEFADYVDIMADQEPTLSPEDIAITYTQEGFS